MATIGDYTAHLKRQKRQQHQALKTQRLAYHLVDGIHGRAERYEEGFYRFFPHKFQSLPGLLLL